MKSIQIKSGERTVTFTSSKLLVDDTSYPYSGISLIRHSADRNAYAFLCGEKAAAFAYEAKDEAVCRALMNRIAGMRDLSVEELPSRTSPEGSPSEDAAEVPSEDAADTASEASVNPRIFDRPVFTGIEAGVAALLLALAVYLFITV